MFDIGWAEMAVIFLVALVVIGPRDLPRVARTMGRWVAKGRAMAREFQTALEDMARETELDTVKKEIEKAARTDLGKSIEKTIDPTGELGTAFDPKATKGTKTKSAGAGKPTAALSGSSPAARPEPTAVAAEPAPNGSATAVGDPQTVGAPATGNGAPVDEGKGAPVEGHGASLGRPTKVPAEPT